MTGTEGVPITKKSPSQPNTHSEYLFLTLRPIRVPSNRVQNQFIKKSVKTRFDSEYSRSNPSLTYQFFIILFENYFKRD